MYKDWDLSILYSSFNDGNFKEDYENLPKEIEKILNFAKDNFGYENVTSNEKEVIENYINMCNKFSKYYNLLYFSSLVLATDTENIEALKIQNTIEEALTSLVSANTAFNAYLLKLDDFEDIIQSSSILKEHEFVLKEFKEEGKYNLSDKEELIIATLQLNGSNAWTTLWNQVTSTLNVDIRLNGKNLVMPLSKIRSMAEDCEQYVRKTAYYAEIGAYPKIEKTAAACLNAIKGEAMSIANLRGYSNVMEMTLKSSRMDCETLNVLISTLEESLPIFDKYFKHKAKLLGHNNKKLPFYDLFAPVGDINMTFTKEEAIQFILKNFNNFSEDLGDFTKNAFDNDWIDWDSLEGKLGGAFCENLHYVKQSRILTNFSGSFSDVLTLAHELGHAYHGEALKDVSFLNTRYSMPIAEVASTFCETLVCNAAIGTATKEEKLVILENNIQGMAQVIVDIYSRYLFESEVFSKRVTGSLSANELKEIMINCQKKSYGDVLTDLHPYMWLCKPHYYYVNSNFYNFPYAYGLLFAKGLYSIYLNEGPTFAQKYKRLLTSTGQNSLYDVGLMVDINIRSKDFWRNAISIIESDIDKFLTM